MLDLLPLAEAKGLDLGVVGDSPAQVLASELDLTMLMRNLVDNAICYTPAGGRIDLAIAVRPDQVEWAVADTGPGIPEAERQRVFDPFYRVLGGTETGTGLGLAIVQTLATRMGARVRLEATTPQGAGLRVTVSFPAP